MAVAYGLVVGFAVYRELRFSDLERLLVTAALRASVVMFVTTTAFLLAWIIAVGRVPDRLGDALSSSTGGELSFLLTANVILIVVGMFMESISAIIVIMPILFPLAVQFGVDPVHFGVLAAVNLCIGMVTPPYGATLFVACTIAGRSVSDVAGWTLRPVAAMIAVQLWITLVPETITGASAMVRAPMTRVWLVAAGLALAACGSERDAVLILKASSSSAPNEPTVRGLEVFGEELARATNGRVVVDVYPNNALGNEREVIELTILGAVELACPANAPLATFAPELLVFDLPYLFRDREHMYRVLDGPIGESFTEPLRSKGLRLLGYFDVGVRHLMTRDEPVAELQDMTGLKIRTMENPLHLRAFETFGASPLPMAYGEVYTALEQGVIDGAEAARSNYVSKRFYEVAPHWAEIGWMHLVAPLVISERVFASLPPEDQEAVRLAARKAVVAEREAYRHAEETALETLVEAGVTITRPDRSQLEELARRMWEASADRVDLELVERIVTTSMDDDKP